MIPTVRTLHQRHTLYNADSVEFIPRLLASPNAAEDEVSAGWQRRIDCLTCARVL